MASFAVAASSRATSVGGTWVPAGAVHAWPPGQNQTLCGLPLASSGLRPFPHVRWEYQRSDRLGATDEVRHVCRRCLAASLSHAEHGRAWTRTAPRP
ncbi:hypothetical protein [Rhizomonospora bruguierae]|uniref:hypothetical protein n=1 Tax=Rhizomonospora bruguierae TaxID=1581705 RepID=UPI0020BDBA17|nr:hypothetical protein [Micromonospora sp. NBRC 107566]